jgi:hypothetical protein
MKRGRPVGGRSAPLPRASRWPGCARPSVMPAVIATIAAALALALVGCSRGARRPLFGSYRSTWGTAVVAGSGNDVAIAYPRGSMRCTRADELLSCGWQSGAGRGRAALRRQPDGSLIGTWGRDESDIDGGGWAFAPVDP